MKNLKKKQPALEFDIGAFELEDVFQDVTDFELPTFFENAVIDDYEDLEKWDWLSQQVIRLHSFKKGWILRREKNYVNHVLFTGGDTGYGKTTGALQFALEISAYYNVPFTLENVFGSRVVDLTIEFIVPMFVPDQILFIDEVQHALHRKRGMATSNVEANKYFDAIRKAGLSTVMTSPGLNSVDKDIVDEKIKWWVHCHRRDDANQKVYAIVYYNATAKSGKESDWVPVEEKVFDWVDKAFYDAVTAKVSGKIYNPMGHEDFHQVHQQTIRDKQEEVLNEQMRAIAHHKSYSIAQKIYRMIEIRIPFDTIHKALKVPYSAVKDVDAQRRLGKDCGEVKYQRKRRRAKDYTE